MPNRSPFWNFLLGRLSWEALPLDNTIVVATFIVVALAGAMVLGLVTYHRRWGYLWREWFTSVDHKKIGVMYVALAVVFPIAALLMTSLQRFATVILSQAEWTIANYQIALSLGPVRTALFNSLMLGFGVASVGVLIMAVLVWIIYRSQLRGRGAIEYLVMFPQAVPRVVE